MKTRVNLKYFVNDYSYVVHVLCDFMSVCLKTLRETRASLKTNM